MIVLQAPAVRENSEVISLGWRAHKQVSMKKSTCVSFLFVEKTKFHRLIRVGPVPFARIVQFLTRLVT